MGSSGFGNRFAEKVGPLAKEANPITTTFICVVDWDKGNAP